MNHRIHFLKSKAKLLCTFIIFTLCIGASVSGKEPETEIKQAADAPPQYEVFEGVPIQFEGKQKEDSKAVVAGYEWKIVSGDGGKLLDDKTSKVTFVAPKISSNKETFILELTTKYKNGKDGKARMNILVHKRSQEKREVVVKEKTVVRDYGPWVGFGFGYIWSRPIYVPIYVPCVACYYDWMELEIIARDPVLLDAAETAILEEALIQEQIDIEIDRAVEEEIEKEIQKEAEQEIVREQAEKEIEKEVEREVEREIEREVEREMADEALRQEVMPESEIVPAPAEPAPAIEPMDIPVDEPMDMPADEPMDIDIPMDLDIGGFD